MKSLEFICFEIRNDGEMVDALMIATRIINENISAAFFSLERKTWKSIWLLLPVGLRSEMFHVDVSFHLNFVTSHKR